MERFFSSRKQYATMPIPRKETAVQDLHNRLAAAQSLFFTDYAGLTVDEITKLRGELRKNGNSYRVVKNTLFRIACGDLATQLENVLAGPTGVVFAGNDPIAPAKALKTFSDTVKKIGIKAAYIDGKLVTASEVNALALLPSKTELIAKLVGSLASPLRGFVTVLSGNLSGLARVLSAIREQKEAQPTV